MAVYNTASDAANTAVRAFLTTIGEYYLGRSFNTGSPGKARQDWEKIRDIIFESNCAYCGKNDNKIQMEHLIMFNREGCGLHHPGNIVPICSSCNKRSKNEENKNRSWEEHLSFVCEKNNDLNSFHKRWTRIKNHISKGEFKYPDLTSEEKYSIKIIANKLYQDIKTQFDQSVKLFEDLDEAFTKKII